MALMTFKQFKDELNDNFNERMKECPLNLKYLRDRYPTIPYVMQGLMNNALTDEESENLMEALCISVTNAMETLMISYLIHNGFYHSQENMKLMGFSERFFEIENDEPYIGINLYSDLIISLSFSANQFDNDLEMERLYKEMLYQMNNVAIQVYAS